jgi:transcriptional regulator with XRE-family HTH domain
MISGAQIRAARGILRWSARQLAEECGLSIGSIQASERRDGIPETMQTGSLMKIKRALERGGVDFGENGEVKLRPKGRK